MLITNHKSLTFLINKRMDEMKPAIARKVIFLQQYDFYLFTKMEIQLNMQMHYRGIYTNIEEDIEPVLNAIQGKHESNSDIRDIKKWV